jgi:toxin CcdB
VFPNPSPRTRDRHPFFVVLQSDVLQHLNTRVVAPLIAPNASRALERFMPAVSILGSKLVIDVANVGVLPVKVATAPVTNLEAERYRIVAAIDLVFAGI